MNLSGESSEYDEFGNKIEKEMVNSSETTFESISDRIDLLNSDEPIYKELKSKVYDIGAFENDYFDAIAAIPDRIFNVVVLGSSSSGKTTFIEHFNTRGACDSTGNACIRTLYEKKFGITTRVSPSINLYSDSHGRSKIVTFIDTPGHCDFIRFNTDLFRCTDNFVLTVSITEPYSLYHDYMLRKVSGNIILVITKVDLVVDRGAEFILERVKYYERPSFSHTLLSSSKFKFITDELGKENIRTICECYAQGVVQESRESNFIDKLVYKSLENSYSLGCIYFNRQLYRLQIGSTFEQCSSSFLVNIRHSVVSLRMTNLNIPFYVRCEPHKPDQRFQKFPVSVMIKVKQLPVEETRCIFVNSRIKLVQAPAGEELVVIEGPGERYLDHMLWEIRNTMNVDFTVVSVFCTYYESLYWGQGANEEQKCTQRSKAQNGDSPSTVVLSPQENKKIRLKRISTFECFYSANNSVLLRGDRENRKKRCKVLDLLSRGVANMAGIVNLSIELDANEDDQKIAREITSSFEAHSRIIYIYTYKIHVVLKETHLESFERVVQRRRIKKIRRTYVGALDVYLVVGTVDAIESLGIESDLSLCGRGEIRVNMLAHRCIRLSERKAKRVLKLTEELLNVENGAEK